MSEFEVGDFVINEWCPDTYGETYCVSLIDRRYVFVTDSDDGEFVFPYSDIRHATPEEIKAGRRLP